MLIVSNKTFKIAYKLLYKKTKTNINDIPFTPEDFSNYFTSKIIDIRSKLEINMTKLSNNNTYTYDQPLTDCTQLSNFRYPPMTIFLLLSSKLIRLQCSIPSP